MRYLLILFLITYNGSFGEKISFADNPVIAHRGAWKNYNHPQNSIAALKQAIALNCKGSEFDVRMTSDEVLIVTHDAIFHNLPVETTTYDNLSKYRLDNGEILPTLEQYIRAGMTNNNSTGLVCEIKPSKFKERNAIIAEKVLDLVKELNAESYVLAYISFSYEILKRIEKIDAKATTQYLDGSKTPEQLKKDGISGLNYLVYKIRRKSDWIQWAKNNDVLLNAWTANNLNDIDWLIANDFDFITTDVPELVFQQLKRSPANKGWKLVWSDEFDNEGKPNEEKWTFEYGFLSNREKQYFTERPNNLRVEKGNLIIEAHKEKIPNKDFKSNAFKDKSWLHYIPEIDTAQYTSARISTKYHASWKYGRIEVKAKLPRGVGLWPAIWMLGNNKEQVGWPECGEIDIMEHVGFNPDSIFGTIHTKAYNHMRGTEKGKKIFIEQPYDSFHVFAIEWTPEKIDFLLDDIVYNQIENPRISTAEWPFDQAFYLIMNVSVGGMLGGQKGIDDSVFPQQMVVDYVRVYQ